MDHLPCPIDGQRAVVAFYARHQVYQPEDFFTLPQKYGYNDFQRLLEDGLYLETSSGAANEFLQSWLFFGLLARVLGAEIDWKDFVNNYNNVLHTKRLNHWLEQWVKREKEDAMNGSAVEQKTRWLRSSMALSDARRFVSKHCSYKRLDRDDRSEEPESSLIENPRHEELDSAMTLSLAILGETLQQARDTWLEMPSALEGSLNFWRVPGTEERSWGYSKYCRELMKKNGHCPLEISRLESTMLSHSHHTKSTSIPSTSIIYYSSSIKSFDPPPSHPDCTVYECKARTKRDVLHMDCDRNCERLQVGESEIVKILESGKTPLVVWTHSGDLICKGYDLKKPLKFGSLSHSWDDAIVDSGRDARNRNDRRIHRCQLDRLQETFNRLLQDKDTHATPKDFPFWVDILCFPREHTVKGKAMNQLKDIYQKASVVLVWERNLLQRPKTAEKDAIEMNMRIRTGDWSWRLWTFQEAVLAENNKLHVAFSNDTVCIDELVRASTKAKENHHDPYHHIWRAGHPFSSPIWKLKKATNREFRVQRVWQAVQFRLITQLVDETIVLSSVLGLEVAKIQAVGALNEDPKTVAAKRMVKFLDLLDATPGLGVPSGIIFLPYPKLGIEGLEETKNYGWAPSTWLSKQSHLYPLFHPQRQTAYVMKRGLLVQFPGLVLHFPSTRVEDSKFWVTVHQCMHKWFKIVVDTRGQDWKSFWLENVPADEEISIVMSTKEPRDRWEIGILVRTKGRLSQGDVRWVRCLARVWVRLETNSNIITDLLSSVRGNSDRMIFAERLEEGQRWCIDGGKD